MRRLSVLFHFRTGKCPCLCVVFNGKASHWWISIRNVSTFGAKVFLIVGGVLCSALGPICCRLRVMWVWFSVVLLPFLCVLNFKFDQFSWVEYRIIIFLSFEKSKRCLAPKEPLDEPPLVSSVVLFYVAVAIVLLLFTVLTGNKVNWSPGIGLPSSKQPCAKHMPFGELSHHALHCITQTSNIKLPPR